MEVKGESEPDARSADTGGKARQRRRTRAAIVAAAADLVGTGATPSVGEIAERADVSRRTVYQHFPTLEQLLVDATVGLMSERAVDEAIEAAASSGGDAGERVEAMIRALAAVSADSLPLGRSLIRMTVTAPSSGPAPRRGFRRVGWIEKALEPLRPRLGEEGFERLVSALAMVVGWEALVVLADLRGLPEKEQLERSLWAARTLIDAAVAEADTAGPD